jgi:hypothetical protein
MQSCPAHEGAFISIDGGWRGWSDAGFPAEKPSMDSK